MVKVTTVVAGGSFGIHVSTSISTSLNRKENGKRSAPPVTGCPAWHFSMRHVTLKTPFILENENNFSNLIN